MGQCVMITGALTNVFGIERATSHHHNDKYQAFDRGRLGSEPLSHIRLQWEGIQPHEVDENT